MVYHELTKVSDKSQEYMLHLGLARLLHAKSLQDF